MEKKGLGYYWDFMDISVIIFIVYSVIGMIFSWQSLLGNILSTVLSVVIILTVFGIIGFNVSKSKDAQSIKHAKVGAYSGIIIGLIAATVALLSFYFFPQTLNEALQKAAASGASASTVRTFMQVGLFAGFVIDPAIYAAIGALLVWVSKFIFKNLKNK